MCESNTSFSMDGYWEIIDRMKEFRQKQRNTVEDDNNSSLVIEEDCMATIGESPE